MQRSRHILSSLLFGAFLLHGCGGTIGGNPTHTTETGETGEVPVPVPVSTGVTVSLSNTPLEGAKNVYLRITGLEITPVAGVALSIPLASPNEIDLLPLQGGASQVLGALADLPAGSYSQTRLQLASDAGRLIDASGVEYPLTIPAGGDAGLTIATAFSKVDAVPLALTLNFDLPQSIDTEDAGGTRRYVLKPVLRLSDNSKTGTISGQGPDGAMVCAYKEGTYQPDDDDDDDDDCDGSFSSARVKNGLFTLPFLDAGRYDLRFIRGETLVGEAKAVDVQAGQTNTTVKVP